jgi:3-oxoacyl-(acyl-carrier-protein) synthase
VQKIVITGYGIKAPMIDNKHQFKEVIEKGICTHEILMGQGPKGSDIVCGVIHNEFELISGRNYKNHPRFSRLAVAAATDAIEQAGLHDLKGVRVAVIMGTSVGGIIDVEKGFELSNNQQYRNFPSLAAGLGNYHSASSAISAHFGINGISFTLSTGCTASTDAIIMGKLLLDSGQVDVCIVGGADAPICPFSIYSFSKLRALSTSGDINQAGVPFSENHEGFVMSEGAGVIILERESDALRRNASIWGVLENGYSNNDSVSIYQSDPSGESMINALKETVGSLLPTYVNSQALGLRANDRVDSIAHQKLFGHSVPITSIKGMIGHSLGAVGALQVISALVSMEYSFIPPTINTSGYGYEQLPIVFETQYCQVDRVAITSHGYGGNNSCVLLSQYSNLR